MGWKIHVESAEEKRNMYKIWSEIMRGRDYLQNLDVYILTLKWFLKTMWEVADRAGISGELCQGCD
jgi:hypothetical protein